MAQAAQRASAGPHPMVLGTINYVSEMSERARFYAVNYARDNLRIDARPMRIEDLRGDNASLDAEGFTLATHKSAIKNFRDDEEVRRLYPGEIESLLLEVTGAAKVIVNPGGVLRFGEKSPEYGSRINTRPARFAHVDYTTNSAPNLIKGQIETAGYTPKPGARLEGFNVWRVISPPPQDVPLALCDLRSIASSDFIPADAIFDAPGQPEWSFEAYVVKYNPAHRWCFFSDMTRDEVLIFRNYTSDRAHPTPVPHVAFDDLRVGPSVAPRASIETRAIAFFD